MQDLLTISLLNDQKKRANRQARQLRLQSARLEHASNYLADQHNFSESLDLIIEADTLFYKAKDWDRTAQRYELAVINQETEIDLDHDCGDCDCYYDDETSHIH